MIKFIVLDVIITSILTSGIITLVIYWLLFYKNNVVAKQRVDDIIAKIKKQRLFFTTEMEDLKKQLKKITEILEDKSKKKT